MNLNDVKFSLTRYRINNLQINVGGSETEPFTVPNNMISGFAVEKDFDNYIFPFYQFQVNVPLWLFNKMKKNSQNIYVQLQLQHAKFNSKEINERVVWKNELNGMYYAILDDASPDPFESKSDDRQKTDKTLNSGYSLGDIASVTLLLYNIRYYHSINTVVNDVVSSANLMDIMMHVLSKSGLDYILISSPTNRKVYSEFKITPIRAIKQLLRICNEYAFHKTGSIVFFDMDRGYIIDKGMTCTAYGPNEYKVTHLMSFPKTGETSTKAGGSYTNDIEKYYLINISPDITVLNESMSNFGEYGNNFIAIDSTSGKVIDVDTGVAGSSYMKKTPTASYVFNGGDDSSSIAKARISEAAKILQVGFSHCHMGMLTPNKEFILSIDDPKLKVHNGKYRLSKFSCIMEQDGSYWSPTYAAEFRG